VFCQNFETSQLGDGAEVTSPELARIMLDLQDIGCHNINFVTPEHVVPQILEALVIAVERGLRLPLVYNTSAYDSLESIQLMEDLVDIYMPDFKLWDAEHCRKYLVASDYAVAARAVIGEMHAQVGELKVDEQGLALRGVLVRHLVMPGLLDDTRKIMHWIADNLSRETYVNVMDQYYPAHKSRDRTALCRDQPRHLRKRVLSRYRIIALSRAAAV
jgi:putative pyruvate formate lyase activating enzyme